MLFLGRLAASKGILELLDAAALLAPRFAALRLVLAGTGDLDAWRRGAAVRGIGEGVELPGWLDAAGRNAVPASAVGGMPEALKNGENGLLVPPRDANALAAALARALEEPALRAPGKQGAHDSEAALFDRNDLRPVGGYL